MSSIHLVYLYLLSPLHTGGTTQEGNLLGIARYFADWWAGKLGSWFCTIDGRKPQK